MPPPPTGAAEPHPLPMEIIGSVDHNDSPQKSTVSVSSC